MEQGFWRVPKVWFTRGMDGVMPSSGWRRAGRDPPIPFCRACAGKAPPRLAVALQLGRPCGLPSGARLAGLAPNSLRWRSGQTGGAKSVVEVRFAHAPQTSAPRRPKSPRPSQPERAFGAAVGSCDGAAMRRQINAARPLPIGRCFRCRSRACRQNDRLLCPDRRSIAQTGDNTWGITGNANRSACDKYGNAVVCACEDSSRNPNLPALRC